MLQELPRTALEPSIMLQELPRTAQDCPAQDCPGALHNASGTAQDCPGLPRSPP